MTITTYQELLTNAWDYDLETPRNYFSAYFIHCVTGEERIFEIYKFIDEETGEILHQKDDSQELYKFLCAEKVLFGYNSRSFDNTILNRIFDLVEQGVPVVPIMLYNLAQMIIKERDTYVDLYKADGKTPHALRMRKKHRDMIKDNRYAKWQRFKGLDLKPYTEVNANWPSLKHCAIHLQHDKIQDLPFPYDHWFNYEESQIFLEYNRNDVIITGKLRAARHKQIQLRIDIAETFGLSLWRTLNASDSKLANLILETLWGDKPSKTSTERPMLRMDDLIGRWVEFTTEPLQKLEKLMRRVILKAKNNYKWAHKFLYDGIWYSIGVGGLHSVDKPRTFTGKSGDGTKHGDGWHYFEIDGGSYYPMIILALGLFPAHLGEKFLKIYRKIVEDRLLAKAMGEAIRAAGLKITVNGTFGKMLSRFFWLFDPKQPLTVTVTGELTLFMLVERMLKLGVHTLSANTDGILIKAKTEDLAAIDEVVQDFSKLVEIPFEYTVYDVFAQRDVNNYAGLGQECTIENGVFVPKGKKKAKVKGALSNNSFGEFDDINFNKGFAAPCVATAVRDYFLWGTNPEVTINEMGDNPHAFMLTQKVDKKFTQYLKSTRGELELQKTNRFVIADKGQSTRTGYAVGSLIKRTWDAKKNRMKDASIVAKRMVAICNDLTTELPPIDYNWYNAAAWDMIDLIKGHGQMSLFGELKDVGAKTEIFDFVSFTEVDEYVLIK